MEREELDGAFNLTSPLPVTVKEFAKTLGAVLNKPAWVSVPGFVVRLAMGQMGTEVLLGSQRVLPRRLVDAGFEFKHPDLCDALSRVYKRRG
jgi:NAD dependent epimerase/dehydratase family enzyme